MIAAGPSLVPQHFNSRAYALNLINPGSHSGTTLHDPQGICRASSPSMARILRIPICDIVGASLANIYAKTDPCLLEPDLFSEVERMGSARATIRPQIPGKGATSIELMAVPVKACADQAIQVMWTPLNGQSGKPDEPQWTNALQHSLHLPKDPLAAAQTVVRSLVHFLDADAAIVLNFEPGVDRYQIVAMSPERQIGREFGPLTNSIFGELNRREVLQCAGILKERFPKCRFTRQGEYRSFHGQAIPGPLGTRLGAVCLLGRAAMRPQEGAASMLKMLAERLGVLQSQHMLEESARRKHLVNGLGELTGAHAHDLRNYLTCIQGAAYQLSRSSTGDDSAPAVQNIQESTQGALELVDAMVDTAREPKQFREAVDLKSLLEKCVGLIQPCARNVTFTVSEVTKTPPALADGAQITQVVINLLRNSVEAMDGSGTIQLLLDVPEAGRGTGPWVRFRILDSGPGLPEELKDRAFDAYSTHSKEKGVGLGLAISESIIREHHGRIEFVECEEKGALISVRLPAVPINSMPKR